MIGYNRLHLSCRRLGIALRVLKNPDILMNADPPKQLPTMLVLSKSNILSIRMCGEYGSFLRSVLKRW